MPSSSSTTREVSAIILAGGKSSRMGTDKALLQIEGEYLIQRIVRQLKAHFSEIIVTTGETKRYEDLLDGVTLLEDEIGNCGPMGGLYTGLKAATNEYSFVTACDMPFLNPNLVTFFLDQIDGSVGAIVPEVGGVRCVTRAIYGKRCLDRIEQLIQQQWLSLQKLLDLVDVRLIKEEALRKVEYKLVTFWGLNTLEEYKHICHMFRIK